MKQLLQSLCLPAVLIVASPHAAGQFGGTTGTVGGSTTGGSAAPGSTTGGLGGRTTQGAGSGVISAAQGGFAGGNTAEGFVGAAGAEGFVGGGREAGVNSSVNRLFRSIQAAEVPTGGTQGTGGNPRRIPVSLRLGFTAPPPQAAALIAGPGGGSFDRFAAARPELQSIAVNINEAGVAMLTGTAPDAEAWRLAANLLRLQPGVRWVDNRIQVMIPVQKNQVPGGTALP